MFIKINPGRTRTQSVPDWAVRAGAAISTGQLANRALWKLLGDRAGQKALLGVLVGRKNPLTLPGTSIARTLIELQIWVSWQKETDPVGRTHAAVPAEVTTAASQLVPSADLAFEGLRVAQSELTGAPALWFASYRTDLAVHSFSNEPGLNSLAAALPGRGGNVTGVLSGALEVGLAIEADWVSVVDTDPRASRVLQTHLRLALLVGGLAEVNGWDETRTADELRRRLGGDAPPNVTAAELHAAGLAHGLSDREVEEEVKEARLAFLTACREAPMNWLTCDQAPQRVAHLIQLARRGHVVWMHADLGDAQAIGDLARFLDHRKVTTRAICLSNLTDYTALVSEVAASLDQLRRSTDAVVITSSGFGRLRGAGCNWRLPVDAPPVGTFERPLAHSATDWFRPEDGVAARLQRAIWSDLRNVQTFWLHCLKMTLGSLQSRHSILHAAGLLAGIDGLDAAAARDLVARPPSNLDARHLLSLGVPANATQAREWLDALVRSPS